eukprot:TRINITY_DN75541_c0_g1_i1.p1 TRINITY_DN75541_c0_g1~~TRINITY_DN75541_c0_g1_i1.p1  ORF type:complete len:182 (-),score=27.61 TRINITY_DN75541_c0_g1_i1:310-855(-)
MGLNGYTEWVDHNLDKDQRRQVQELLELQELHKKIETQKTTDLDVQAERQAEKAAQDIRVSKERCAVRFTSDPVFWGKFYAEGNELVDKLKDNMPVKDKLNEYAETVKHVKGHFTLQETSILSCNAMGINYKPDILAKLACGCMRHTGLCGDSSNSEVSIDGDTTEKIRCDTLRKVIRDGG